MFPELNGNVLVKQVNFRLENLTDALNKIITKILKDYSLFLVTEEYKIWLYIQLEKLCGNLHKCAFLSCDSFECSKILILSGE